MHNGWKDDNGMGEVKSVFPFFFFFYRGKLKIEIIDTR